MSEEALPEELPPEGPEEVAAFIKDVVLASRRSRRHRGPISKGTLKALAAWERDVTNNYGVEK